MPEPSPQHVANSILEKLSTPASSSNPTVNAGSILKNLDGQFISRYILRLEEAKKVLGGYLYEIEQIEKRLNKVSSPATRKVLGEDALVAKREAIAETLKKLEAHQANTIKRLRDG